jgi:hypothetical protein
MALHGHINIDDLLQIEEWGESRGRRGQQECPRGEQPDCEELMALWGTMGHSSRGKSHQEERASVSSGKC